LGPFTSERRNTPIYLRFLILTERYPQIGLGGTGDQGDGGGEGDAYEIGVGGDAGDGKGNGLIEGILNQLEGAGGGDGSDGVDVTRKRTSAAIKDYVLNTGSLEECEPQGILVGT
jgi:hypothetical protein